MLKNDIKEIIDQEVLERAKGIGGTTVPEISRSVKTKRQNVYNRVRDLISKGLIFRVRKPYTQVWHCFSDEKQAEDFLTKQEEQIIPKVSKRKDVVAYSKNRKTAKPLSGTPSSRMEFVSKHTVTFPEGLKIKTYSRSSPSEGFNIASRSLSRYDKSIFKQR